MPKADTRTAVEKGENALRLTLMGKLAGLDGAASPNSALVGVVDAVCGPSRCRLTKGRRLLGFLWVYEG